MLMGNFTPRFSDEFQTLSEVEKIIFMSMRKQVAINEEILTDENLKKLDLKREELVQKKAVEVGNTFHLESKYTDALDVYYFDDKGERKSIIMGCWIWYK